MTPPIVWIAGGKHKGADLAPLAESARGRVRVALLIGEAAAELDRALAGTVPCERVGDLAKAVARAAEIARPGIRCCWPRPARASTSSRISRTAGASSWPPSDASRTPGVQNERRHGPPRAPRPRYGRLDLESDPDPAGRRDELQRHRDARPRNPFPAALRRSCDRSARRHTARRDRILDAPGRDPAARAAGLGHSESCCSS